MELIEAAFNPVVEKLKPVSLFGGNGWRIIVTNVPNWKADLMAYCQDNQVTSVAGFSLDHTGYYCIGLYFGSVANIALFNFRFQYYDQIKVVSFSLNTEDALSVGARPTKAAMSYLCNGLSEAETEVVAKRLINNAQKFMKWDPQDATVHGKDSANFVQVSNQPTVAFPIRVSLQGTVMSLNDLLAWSELAPLDADDRAYLRRNPF